MTIFRFSVKTLKKICFCSFESLYKIKNLSLQFKENQILHHIDFCHRFKNYVKYIMFKELLVQKYIATETNLIDIGRNRQ